MTTKNRPAGTVDGPLDRSAVLDVAQADIPKIFAYDYQTVERSLTEAYPLLTPKYRQEFEKSANTRSFPRPRSARLLSSESGGSGGNHWIATPPSFLSS